MINLSNYITSYINYGANINWKYKSNLKKDIKKPHNLKKAIIQIYVHNIFNKTRYFFSLLGKK